VDTRDTAEQAELRRSAHRLARAHAPVTVSGLDDETRARRLAAAVRDAGWLELRDDAGDGAPLASGVEAAIVAGALGAALADVAYAGKLLARDLARRARARPDDGIVVAYSPDLTAAAVAGRDTAVPAYAVDAAGCDAAYVLVPDADRYRLARVSLAGEPCGSDLTRSVRAVPASAEVSAVDHGRPLTRDDVARWEALGLALTCADLVGVMRGALEISVEYATQRRQFGVPVGSFQAVQHMLAEAHCLLEGSVSVAQHAAWAVDELPPAGARAAGRVAKAYCARAARTVCETAIQVHGGIGNTWDCIAHVYLRRALLSSQWFGDDGEQLRELQRERLGATVGLP
jgi:alkylation response protein AidB-like acyl-CoA dehydrogenase